MIDFRKNLNKAQYEAVANDKGPMLILAGAGSGKTRVIEYRTLYLVDSGVNPKSILLLTFTKRAAFEMLSRVVEKDERCQEIEGGTFHSFAYKVLRRYSGLIEIENSFLVLDESDSSDLINQSAKKIGINDKNFPKKETIREIISASINKGMSIGDALEIQYPHFNRFISEIEAIKVEYGKAKKERNYVDYDDLLVDLRLLLKNESIRKELSRRYNYIMVDEYQDTNPIQGEITYLLGKDHQNIVVVGDDAQTIYGFRGSSHKNIMNFPKFFPKSKIVTLESNYRSTQSILDLANAVLENMEEKYSKVLVSGNKDLGEKPKLTCYKDQYSEAHGIATKIESLITNGEDVKGMGVLFRSSFHSIALQMELDRRRIPFRVVGGRKFYEMAHVKDFISYLRVISNFRDDLSWRRILTLLPKIGVKRAEGVISNIAKSSKLKEALGHLSNSEFIEVTELAQLIEKASAKGLKVSDRLEIIFNYYLPILKNNYDNWNKRLEDIEVIKEISGRYSSLRNFLIDFTIDGQERGTTDLNKGMVTLSTIHSAKGLEWNTLFIMNMTDGSLPISFSFDSKDELEEEQRLFYVAITRAKKRLYISYSLQSRAGYSNELSRFIEMPNVISKLDLSIFSPEYLEMEIIDD